jgi:hypothetical protein
MYVYRLITGLDDASFCHRITDALNKGWMLHGSPALTFDTVQGQTICGQAVYKDVPDKQYHSEMKLGEQ